MLKLYTLVRDDLRPADKAVQSTHAVANFAAEHPKKFAKWQAGSNTLVVLEVPGRGGVKHWNEVLLDGGYKVSMFYETSRLHVESETWSEALYGGTNTALTVEPDWLLQNVVFKGLPLASFAPKPRDYASGGLVMTESPTTTSVNNNFVTSTQARRRFWQK